MSVPHFLKKDNIQTIWSVIMDEDLFTFLSKEIQTNVYKLFLDNIKGFFEVEIKKPTSLIDMNKKYILLILNHIQKNYPYNVPNKIKIFEETDSKEAITFEEIQNEKKTQFEWELMKKQQEFNHAITREVPPPPQFKDNFSEEPLGEIDKILKEMTAKRNYDVERIQKSHSQKENQTWLKPEETNIKNEKFIAMQANGGKNETGGKNEITGKNVSWGKNEVFLPEEQEEENAFFKKLKRVHTYDNITLALNEKTIEDRLQIIEEKIEHYDKKMDRILYLLEENIKKMS
jgi:hypothetical protein